MRPASSEEVRATFATHVDDWKEWQEEPWGRIRYTVARANLGRYLPAGPRRILDLGGGNGKESIAFANEGHDVTLVDFSPEMLAEAQRGAERLGVARRMAFVLRRAEDLSSLDLAAQFDVALSHNVIQYVEDPACHVNALRDALKPGGVVSILSVNACSEVYRAILQREEPVEALEQLGAKTHRAGMFDVKVLRYTPDEIGSLLANAGFETLATCGVRCFIDYIANNERKYEPEFYALLEKLEQEVSGRFPFNATARFFQLIARRG